jgi:protein-S-isoprenylcysteine O-methyltransferase Ste14
MANDGNIPEAGAEPAPAPDSKPTRPRSASHFGLNCIALGVVLLAMYLVRKQIIHPKDEVAFMAGAVAIPVLFFDIVVLKVHRRASTGIDWDRPFTLNFGRIATKLVGFVVTIAPFILLYWVFPEYPGWTYPFFRMMRANVWTAVVAVPLYFAVIDGQMKEPEDTYYQLGRIVLGRPHNAKKFSIANHYRGWLVKAFFFPFMFLWMSNSTHNVITYDLSTASWSNMRAYNFLYDFIFFIDLIFCTVGYALSLRPIDTHIRTAEPTMLGWATALFCYPPFYNLMERSYVGYGGNNFDSWLSGHPTLRWVWAGGILALITIYSLATVAFGVRFSNLTHRGVLTDGPYRFTKHPAYVTKNISWWLVSIPCLALDAHWETALKHSIGLVIINFIYFMRARTEERHLSRDPVYVQYALWMNEHGVLRFLNAIPGFRYKAPAPGAYSGEGSSPALYGGTAPTADQTANGTPATEDSAVEPRGYREAPPAREGEERAKARGAAMGAGVASLVAAGLLTVIMYSAYAAGGWIPWYVPLVPLAYGIYRLERRRRAKG